MALVERNTAEVIGADELPPLMDAGLELRHYIGFEISGKAHLGTGLMSMAKVRDLTAAGVHCSVLLADWHTWINDKLGGDRELIRRIATGYFTEAFRASLLCVDADPGSVEFVLASDLYRDDDEYWATVIEVSKNTTLARMQRSISILGRQERREHRFRQAHLPGDAGRRHLHARCAHRPRGYGSAQGARDRPRRRNADAHPRRSRRRAAHR